MKGVDGDKDKFWGENDKFYHNQDEISCCLEPWFPINNRMTMVFSKNDEVAVKKCSCEKMEKIVSIFTFWQIYWNASFLNKFNYVLH